VASEDFRVINSQDELVNVQVITGLLNDTYGRIATQTPVNTYIIDAAKGGTFDVPINTAHQGMIYLIKGEVTINGSQTLKFNDQQLVWFEQDGNGFSMEAQTDSKLLFLSGEPFNEKVTSWGPYVMNNQTEIMEALRDYQQGKMGFLTT